MTEQRVVSGMTLADIDAYYGGLLREIQELQELLKINPPKAGKGGSDGKKDRTKADQEG